VTPREDQELIDAFRIADDALLGVVLHHKYLIAAIASSRSEVVEHLLPQGCFQLTHDWALNYHPSYPLADIARDMTEFRTRLSLIGTVSVFESAVSRFLDVLSQRGKPLPPVKGKTITSSRDYRPRLHLVWEIIQKGVCDDLNPDQMARLLRDVDVARWLRNCIVHNHGQIDREYKPEAICLPHPPDIAQIERDYVVQRLNSVRRVRLTDDQYEYFSRSHIRLLIVLFNAIRYQHFGVTQGYNYARDGKRMDIHRALTGDCPLSSEEPA
jgi:hypothetical protein